MTEEIFRWPENADRYYRILDGSYPVNTVAETELSLAFTDPAETERDGEDHVMIIPKVTIPSLTSMDFSDALYWVDIHEALKRVDTALGWTGGDGFRLDIPVNPPYQREPWLVVHLRRSSSKKPKPQTDSGGWSRHDGHFTSILDLDRRVDIVYYNRAALAFIDPEDEDNLDYDTAISVIHRHKHQTVLDAEFTSQDWLAITSACRLGAQSQGLSAYWIYFNIRPPYQNTAWVHAHVLAGPRAIHGKDTKKIHKTIRREVRAHLNEEASELATPHEHWLDPLAAGDHADDELATRADAAPPETPQQSQGPTTPD
ncbi:MAG: hypothetical protein WCI74_18645 [Actinomycetes bacterium]